MLIHYFFIYLVKKLINAPRRVPTCHPNSVIAICCQKERERDMEKERERKREKERERERERGNNRRQDLIDR